MKIRSLAVLALVVLGVILAVVPGATITDATETRSFYESPSSIHYYYQTPSLAALGADTARIAITIPKDIPYLDLSSGPTWRLILGARTSTAGADSLALEVWHGVSSPLYRSTPLASNWILDGATKTVDITGQPLSAFRHLTFYLTNADSTAAIFDVDVVIVKGR